MRVILSLKREIIENDRHFLEEELNGFYTRDQNDTWLDDKINTQVDMTRVNVKVGQKIDTFKVAGKLMFK